jgi:hypothetical protein
MSPSHAASVPVIALHAKSLYSSLIAMDAVLQVPAVLVELVVQQPVQLAVSPNNLLLIST